MILQKLSPFIAKIAYTLLFYVLISWNCNPSGCLFFSSLLIYFSFYLGIGFFGYFLNDISDEASDKLAGKNNISQKFSSFQKAIIIIVLVSVGSFPISIFYPSTIPFVLSEVFFLIVYSLPPIRLKEKGLLGIIVDSLYAYLIPSLILLLVLEHHFSIDFFYWFVFPSFSFFLGIRNILNHQIEDYDNDLISGVKTFTNTNLSQAIILNNYVLIISIFIWILSYLYLQFCSEFDLITAIFLCVGIVFFIKLIASHVLKKKALLLELPEFTLIYYGYLFFVIYVLVFQKWSYLFLIFVFIFSFLFGNGKLLGFILKKLFLFLKMGASLTVNYSLYYFFLIFSIDLKARAERRKTINSVQIKIQCIPIVEKNVHSLWIGNQLSKMELLTINTFIAQGYKFHLWTYESLKNMLPEECVVCDANDIIPFERVFKYKYSSQFGTGKGSYAGFSDIFRYKLLYDKGGWWVDMDVTCLKPFDVAAPYFFRSHHDLSLVGNIMKAPKGSSFMLKCYEDAVREVDENNRDWHKPIEILVKNVFKFELQKYILSDVSNTDEWHKIRPFVYSNKLTVPSNWHFIHWCNEVWRTNSFDKNTPFYASFYGQLLMKYKLIPVLQKEKWKKNDRILRIRLTVERLLDFI